MGHPADENLPEVVPDQSPQALSAHEAHFRHEQLGEQHPKYPVYVEDSPKFSAVDPKPGFSSPVSPEHAVPWEKRSVGGDLVAGDRVPTMAGDKRGSTICGLKRKLFWLLLAAVLVIVAGSVGGGVGGGIAAAKARDGASAG